MSGAATFPCPCCGMTYPLKPVLIGKPVRCKGCRNAFVLQGDGTARKVEDQPAAPPLAPAPVPSAAPAPAPAVAAIDLDDKTPPASAQVLSSKPTSERIARRKSEHLEAARAQMAAQLAEVASKAAESEGAKHEERKSQRLTKAGPAGGKPAGAGDPAAVRRIVLTGEGERQFAETLRWWIGFGVAAAVILLLIVVLNLRSTVRQVLDDYCAPVPTERNRYPFLAQTVRTRAWLATAPSMPDGLPVAIELADAEFAAERVIDLAPLREALAGLKGLRYDAALGAWIAPADLAAARRAVAGRAPSEVFAALTEAGLRHRPHRAVFDTLPGSEEDRGVLFDLLAGTPPEEGQDFAKRLLDAGQWPDRVVVRPFSGRSGEMLVDRGRPPYVRLAGPYEGALMRCEGGDWPAGWRMLRLSPRLP